MKIGSDNGLVLEGFKDVDQSLIRIDRVMKEV
jgi:hypothetical protein